MKVKYIVILLALSINITNSIADIASDYQDTQKYITSNNLAQSLNNSLANSGQSIPNIPSNPSQQKYYNNANSMSADAMSTEFNDPNVNQIEKSAVSRPRIEINTNSDAIKNSQLVQQNAAAIASGTYKDCNKEAFKKNVYVNKTCVKPNAINLQCDDLLQAAAFKPEIPKPCNHVIRIDDGSPPPAGAALLQTFSWRPFRWFWWDVHTVSFYSVPSSSDSDVCLLPNTFFAYTGSSSEIFNASVGAGISAVAYGELVDADNKGTSIVSVIDDKKTNVASINATIAGATGQFKNSDLKNSHNYTVNISNKGTSTDTMPLITVSYIVEPKNPVEIITTTWNNTCEQNATLINNPACHLDSSKCVDAATTKTIDGVPVTEPCWDNQSTYICGGSGSDTCSALANQNCEQINSTCADAKDGVCLSFNETWSCPVSVDTGDGLQCGEQFYCLDGSCQQVTPSPSADFGQAITELSAAASAGNDVKGQGTDPNVNPADISIFKGQVAHCRDLALGAMNCCADSGWAKGIITHCNDEETNLGLAKEKTGIVVYTGKYCAHRILGFCLESKKGYCIFPSKLATDVQVGGRAEQLHKGFGDGQNPDCSGISPSDLGKIDFSKIDFTNAIDGEESKTDLPPGSQSENDIEAEIQDMMQRDTPHG
jgi:type-F conjugative transfer system mating-pair stabilization protein TraN